MIVNARGTPRTVLGLDDLVTAKLDAVHQVRVGLTASGGDLGALGDLAEEGDDGDARVAADDLDVGLGRVGLGELGDKGRGADDVEGGDAEEPAGVEDAGLLVDLGDDGDGRVDGVGDDEHVRLGRRLGRRLREVADDGGIGLVEVSAQPRTAQTRERTLKRSSRVMPGLRGTPAGTTMISAP
jgi:hypothetical protein